MSKELLLVIESVSNEKEVSRDLLFSAMEEALSIATKKRFEEHADIFVKINRKTGEYETFRRWEIVSENCEHMDYSSQLYVDIALEKGHDVKVGDTFLEKIKSTDFSRISAIAAKQIIMKKVRNEERRNMILKLSQKIGKILYTEVKRVFRDYLVLDLGNNSEGIIFKKDLLPNESYRINDKLRACLWKIDQESKNYPVILTRTHKKMLEALLTIEVPEISENLIHVIDIARDPGSRSKIAVKSEDSRIDPIGACVGMRGSRIQAISNELGGEKIDVVLWDNNPAKFVINALSPAEVVSIIQDEDKHSMQVAVIEEQLSQAIGKNGQNVRLATLLTGWGINVLTNKTAEQNYKKEVDGYVENFINKLDVDNDVAHSLVKSGLSTLEEIAYIPYKEMMLIEGFDEDMSKELQERAKTALISQALSRKKPIEDLLSITGMTVYWAQTLVDNNIMTIKDLAELSIDDLMDIIDIQESKAANLIMTARAPWFNDTTEKL